MKKGFTLVELSIVLVIIGLLVGGILAAQSMISSAKINSVAQQISGFDAAVLSFKEKYNYLPGDAPGFGGDGDGIIDETAVTGDDNTTIYYGCEISRFWYTMDPVTYATSVCANASGTKAFVKGANKNVPISKLGTQNSFFIVQAETTDGSVINTTSPKNYYAILGGAQLGGPNGYGFPAPTTNLNSATTPAELFALDTKIDDGRANAGYVRSGSMLKHFVDPYGGMYASPYSGYCSSGSTYYIANQENECTPIIRVGGSAKVPQ